MELDHPKLYLIVSLAKAQFDELGAYKEVEDDKTIA
jgi:hypothetical protein